MPIKRSQLDGARESWDFVFLGENNWIPDISEKEKGSWHGGDRPSKSLNSSEHGSKHRSLSHLMGLGLPAVICCGIKNLIYKLQSEQKAQRSTLLELECVACTRFKLKGPIIAANMLARSTQTADILLPFLFSCRCSILLAKFNADSSVDYSSLLPSV